MLYGMGLSGTGSQIERARLENVSNNLANLDTVGFKRDLLTVMQRPVESQDVQLPWESERLFWQHDLLDKIGGGVHLNQTYTVHESGPLDHTGTQEDLALTRDGFFTVREAGTNHDFYTRAGNFEINQEGWLVTKDGQHFVLNAKGQPINMGQLINDNGGTGFAVNTEGGVTIVTPTRTIPTDETIGVAVFADERDLNRIEKVGRNMYRAQAGVAERAVQLTSLPAATRMGTTEIRQGFREGSGVDAAMTMVEMIEVSRAFERNMKLLQMQDGTLDDLIRRVGTL